MEPDQAPALVDIPEYARTLAVEWFGEPSAPLLFRAVNLEMWDICRRLLTERDTETSCKELRYVDLYGYSALHYASWWSASAPLDVLQSIIQHTERHFSSLPNRKGRTPLHLAAWRGRDEVVEILAEKCPEAAGVMDRTHKTPLVDACFRNRSRNVLQALVKADPDQIKQSNHCGRSAASLFFRISYGFVSLPTRTRFQEEQEQEIFLAKSKVILAAERIALDKEPLNFDEDVNLVHAAMDSPSCPFPVVKYLLEKLDDGTIRDFRDSCGDTFLHIASKADRFHFESFFQCDRCQESANAFEELQIMHFNRDPESPHWGARCSNASCRKSSRPLMIHYVQVPVGKSRHETDLSNIVRLAFLSARSLLVFTNRNQRKRNDFVPFASVSIAGIDSRPHRPNPNGGCIVIGPYMAFWYQRVRFGRLKNVDEARPD